MPVRIGSGLSTVPDARVGALEAASAASRGLEGEPCDVALVFATGVHLAAPEATLEAVQEVLEPGALIGCGAEGVIGGRREIERGTAVSVWCAALGGGEATPFHAAVEPLGEGSGVGALTGLPPLEDASAVILLADPASFPTDAVLRALSEQAPELPLIGGLAAARLPDDATALFMGDEVVEDGAVGLRLDGVDVIPCVSQGAAPIGPELTITAGEGHVIAELAGRPALAKLRETIEELPAAELALVEQGLLVGIVVDANKPEYVRGDFLVRGLVGADPESGRLAVGTEVRPGQVVRLHARDAESADEDLRAVLDDGLRVLNGRRPAGALVFACNGRGRGMFGSADHDAEAVVKAIGGAPAAGFFAAGEIGPVGGEYFLHSFTATVAVFA